MRLSGVYDYFNRSLFDDVDDIWAVSDTHFGDRELREGEPHRPNDDEIVRRINAKCGRKSALIHLGDVGDLSYVRQLRAKKKILILGNHDKGAEKYRRIIYRNHYDCDEGWTRETALADAAKKHPNCEYQIWKEYDVSHRPFVFWVVESDNRLFDHVFEGPLTLGEKIILSHEPIPIITWAKNIHGHRHSDRTPEADPYHYNICLEAQKFEPFHFSAALKKGLLKDIKPLHRETIDTATERAAKRKGVKK